MVELAGVFHHLQPFKVLVLGDFMLDAYTSGKVKRISPEAPVPVLEVHKQEERAGGAGNVVLNLLALGATVWAAGRVGDDAAGKRIYRHLEKADTSALLVEPGYQTPVKTRLIADSQQLLRIDCETIQQMSSALEAVFLEKLERIIPEVQIVAISDYGKGFLTEKVLQFAIALASKYKIASIVDPKGTDFSKYQGASLIKPNLSEAVAAAKCQPQADLREVAEKLSSYTNTLLITRSEAGISVFEKEKRADFPVRFREVKDVTGAGDTVLATICLALANGLDMQIAAQLANIAAGIAIERVGCVQVTLSQLAERLLEYTANTKIFDEGHVFALRKALQDKKYSLLCLEKKQAMTGSLLQTIRDLSAKEAGLIVYIQDCKETDPLVQILTHVGGVKSIILQKEGLKSLCSHLIPSQVYAFEEEKLTQAKTLIDSLLLQADAMTAPPRQSSF